jgi:hypothetical protein
MPIATSNGHVLEFMSEDDVSVTWRCINAGCIAIIGFAKEGFGEPHATSSTLPDDVASYLSPCPIAPPAPPPLIVSREDLVNRFTMEELGTITLSVDPTVRGMVLKFQVLPEIDLNAPESQAAGALLIQLGLLTQERLAQIMAG